MFLLKTMSPASIRFGWLKQANFFSLFWFCVFTIVAQVLSSDIAEVTLIELVPTDTSGHYRSNLHSVWCEPITACHFCDANFDESKNVYVLRTPPSDITGLLKEDRE